MEWINQAAGMWSFFFFICLGISIYTRSSKKTPSLSTTHVWSGRAPGLSPCKASYNRGSFPTSSSIFLPPPGNHSTRNSCMDRELRMPLERRRHEWKYSDVRLVTSVFGGESLLQTHGRGWRLHCNRCIFSLISWAGIWLKCQIRRFGPTKISANHWQHKIAARRVPDLLVFLAPMIEHNCVMKECSIIKLRLTESCRSRQGI